VVAHNGGDYLPRTLAALSEQTRPVDAFIGVDTGSRDNSLALLDQAFGEANVTTFQQGRAGMGDAVKAGLAALAPRNGDPGDSVPQDSVPRDSDRPAADAEWIWLLHDDAAPAPEALAELLHAVERAPSVTVAGCKQLDWHARRRLIDVGLSTSRWAERLTLIEADELDQGQYDGRSDTFAVNSAGMLVRRDVWEELGGFDAALPGTGDDVDFCWRNRLAGHRVVVVPTARMFHVSHRPHALGSASAARKAQVYLRLMHTVWW
jgi:GT2 family glycosyltransferase